MVEALNGITFQSETGNSVRNPLFLRGSIPREGTNKQPTSWWVVYLCRIIKMVRAHFAAPIHSNTKIPSENSLVLGWGEESRADLALISLRGT